MRRGTTPAIVIEVEGEQFGNSTVYVTIKQQGIKDITIVNPDMEITDENNGCKMYVYLTQEQTLSLRPGVCYVQIRWIDSNGIASASEICKLNVKDILKNGVIAYENPTK